MASVVLGAGGKPRGLASYVLGMGSVGLMGKGGSLRSDCLDNWFLRAVHDVDTMDADSEAPELLSEDIP